jgi:thiaminase/transcriptional activator TenA
MSFTDHLYEAAEEIWEAQLSHPFVQGIGDGSLPEEKFRRWVLQDYRYLEDFARIFAWAAARADRLESMGWYASVLDLTLNSEMELHREYAARFGISREELESTPAWPTTRAYTDFLVRSAAEGDMGQLLAALLPCAWGYAWIARRLADGAAPGDRRYADWIEQYTAPEFRDAARWLREETDRVARGRSPEERDRMRHLFVVSSRYEWRFWEMCWTGESWGPPGSAGEGEGQ